MGEINLLEQRAVILGALLHDIGKFVQRAQENPRAQDHSRWGEEWFQNSLAEKLSPVFDENNKQIIRSAISNHHAHEKYISLADAISAGMDRISLNLDDEEKGDPFTDRLISIFSRVSISAEPKKQKYQSLLPLGGDNLTETFPIDERKCFYHEYEKLLDSFERELKSVDFSKLLSPQVIDSLYFLLSKHAWCIPSAAYKDEPDVSLFDHLKTTAAIAGCLYAYHKEKPDKPLDLESEAFCLVGGDISGIQSYIFNVLNQQGKVAKRLRARSLTVQLMSEIASHQIAHGFDLPLCNIISSAGGNFYLLLPNTCTVESKLRDFQRQFDEFTHRNFKAEIFLSLGWVTANGKKLARFDDLLEELKLTCQERKYNPYQTFFVANSHWKKDKFLLDEVIQGDEQACTGCHIHPIINEREKLCTQCDNDIVIGTNLPKINYITCYKDAKHRFPVLNYSYEFAEELPKDQTAYLVLALNNTEPGVGFKFIANHIPSAMDVGCLQPEHNHEESPIAFFDCIADTACGDKHLGYIKVDVDDMGKILRWGFDPEEPQGKHIIPGIRHSISRFCSLSRMLEIFFAGYLQKRLENEYKELYTVFSGGDDFFILGPWNKAIDFACEMRKEFTRFCAENPDLKFSSGIILAKPHEPISFCARTTDEKLKASKSLEGKDRITLFDQTVRWYDIDRILKEAQRVIAWLENQPPIISRGLAYNLREYGEMSSKYEETKDTRWLKFVPLLIYDINRNLSKEKQQEAYDWSLNLSPTIKKKIGNDNLPYLRIIMEYVLTYTRGANNV